MDIYTGRGDQGLTDLRDTTRVSKTSPRIEAYGTVDELNALVGTVRPTGHDDVDDVLASVQNHLHVVQADLANPDPDDDDPVVRAEHAEDLEATIDEFQAELEPLEQFVLPGGSEIGARLHHARTVCRRAERRVVGLAEAAAEGSAPGTEAGETAPGGDVESADGVTGHGDAVNEAAVVYLNRLSDCLFVLGRVVNSREGVPEENPEY